MRLIQPRYVQIRKMVFVDPDFTPEDVAFLQALEFEVEDYKVGQARTFT